MLAPEPLSVEEFIAAEMEANKYRKPPLLPHELAEELETKAVAVPVPDANPADPLEDLTFGDLLKQK